MLLTGSRFIYWKTRKREPPCIERDRLLMEAHTARYMSCYLNRLLT